jgi:acetyl-CoA C-acetyltransferase
MNPVHLIDAKRSAIGRFGGGFKDLSPVDLACGVAKALLPADLAVKVDEVIMGQVLQAGGGMNVARQLGIKLGLRLETPAHTVNMACGSSLKAVALGADSIALGRCGLVLAGGVEVMSRAPHLACDQRYGRKLGDALLKDSLMVDGLSDPLLGIGMGETAERIAEAFAISRADQDEFAAQSQARALAHRDSMAREIVEVAGLGSDEHPRPESDLAALAKLKPAFRREGSVTAGNASGINDGAAMLLLANEAAINDHGLVSRARILGCEAVGCDPAMMGLGPIGAIRQLCQRLQWDLDEVEAIEINEAFAVQALACLRELRLDPKRLNPRGGAIALGHPIGASGARVLVTLLHHMEDAGLRRGIASLCIGGGMGIAMAIER